MFSILVVGRDVGLLSTRAAVLSRMTPAVVEATPDLALHQLANQHFDLVVLCHTLRVDEAVKIAQSARASHRSARIIQVVALDSSRTTYQDIPVDAFTDSSPVVLVQKAKQLMNGFDNRPSVGAPW